MPGLLFSIPGALSASQGLQATRVDTMGGEPSAGLPRASGVELSHSPCLAPLPTLLAFMKPGHPIPGSDVTELGVGGVAQNPLETSVWLLQWPQTHCSIR